MHVVRDIRFVRFREMLIISESLTSLIRNLNRGALVVSSVCVGNFSWQCRGTQSLVANSHYKYLCMRLGWIFNRWKHGYSDVRFTKKHINFLIIPPHNYIINWNNIGKYSFTKMKKTHTQIQNKLICKLFI